MAEHTGEVATAPVEREVVWSRLVSPFREVDEYLINDGVREVEGRIKLSRQLTERLKKERPDKRLLGTKKGDEKPDDQGTVSREELKVRELQDDFRVFVKWMVDDGLVKPKVAIRAGYYARPSSVGWGELPAVSAYFLNRQGFHAETKAILAEKERARALGERFDDRLPVVAHPELTGIRLTERGIGSVSLAVERATKGVVIMTEAERKEYARWMLLAHEYGHALVRAKHFEEFENMQGDISEAEEEWLAKWTRELGAKDMMGKPVELLGISLDERVAVGTETYVLERLLMAKGVDEPTRQSVLNRYLAVSVDRYQADYLLLVEHGKEKGLSIEDLRDVEEILRRNGTVMKRIGVFSGYGFPLTEEQLKEFLG